MPICKCSKKLILNAENSSAVAVLLALLIGIFLPLEAVGAPANFTIDFPLSSSIGPLRAGRLCLPKGVVHGTDLVADETQFALLVRQVLDERAARGLGELGDGSTPKVELHLKSAEVKLCAKSWGVFGMGDTKSLSGDAEFVFAWRTTGQGPSANQSIMFKAQSKDRMAAPAILRRAVEMMLDRIAATKA